MPLKAIASKHTFLHRNAGVEAKPLIAQRTKWKKKYNRIHPRLLLTVGRKIL